MAKKRKLKMPRRLTESDIRLVEIAEGPAFTQRKLKGARAAGLKYEEKVHNWLSDRYGPRYVRSPWFRYFIRGRTKPLYAQPDALIFDLQDGLCTIIEIKLRHCVRAYWQLEHLYLPLLRTLLRSAHLSFSTCEICSYFDPAEPFPVPIYFTEIPHADANGFRVYILKEGRDL